MDAVTSKIRRKKARRHAGPGFPAAAIAIISALAAVAMATTAFGQSAPHQGAVLTETDAYLLLPPQLIAGPIVERVSISPSSRNVAALRKTLRIGAENLPSPANPNPVPPREEQELIFWNAAIRKPVSLWQSAQPGTQVSLSPWLPGTESVFALTSRTSPPEPGQPEFRYTREWKLLLLGLGIERAVVLPLPTGQYEHVEVQVSPAQPVAIVKMTAAGPPASTTLLLVHRNGRVGAKIDLPDSARAAILWNAAGEPVLALTDKDNNQKPRAYYGVDLLTGHAKPLPKEPQWQAAQRVAPNILPFHVVTRSQEITLAGSVERISPVWLEGSAKSESPRALLAADGADVTLQPDSSGALYTAQSSLWFTPFLKTGKAYFLAARTAAQKAVVISNAKQLGLAAIMYSQDNDETLPGPDGIQDKLSPFLNNDRLFAGFTYTYPGGTLAEIAAPAETILGYVAGPGGRAVIYVDGHVKWAPN
jgi:hypothetical protein